MQICLCKHTHKYISLKFEEKEKNRSGLNNFIYFFHFIFIFVIDNCFEFIEEWLMGNNGGAKFYISNVVDSDNHTVLISSQQLTYSPHNSE